VRALAFNCPAESLEYLERAAGDPDRYVRERAVQALSRSDVKKAIKNVVPALRDRDEYVRWRALQGLCRLRARNVVTEIAPLAGDSFWKVRTSTHKLLEKSLWEKSGLKNRRLQRKKSIPESCRSCQRVWKTPTSGSGCLPVAREARDVTVRFYYGQPIEHRLDERLIGEVRIPSIPASEFGRASVEWDATGFSGRQRVYVVVDPFDRIPELWQTTRGSYTMLKKDITL
jgi:hypothetical protein